MSAIGTTPPPTPLAVPAPKPLPARRRRPGMIAVAIALIAVGALGSMALYLKTGHRVAVLAVTEPIQDGQVIKASDLTVANISLDPAISPISAGSEAHLLAGHQRATTALNPGALLVPADLSPNPVVQSGDTVVPIQLTPAQQPATALAQGVNIDVVYTTGQTQGTVNTGTSTGARSAAGPTTVAGTVVSVSAANDAGDVTADIAVPAIQGPSLAAHAATGDIALNISSGGS